MKKRYLDQFYSYKWVAQEARLVSQSHAVAAIDLPERKERKEDVKALIDDANKLFNEEKYQLALTNYLQARKLIFGLLNPGIRSIFNNDFRVELKANIFDHLLSGALVAAKVNTTGDWRTKKIAATIAPPEELFDHINAYTGRRKSTADLTSDYYRHLGEMYVLIGDLDRSIKEFERALKLTDDDQKIADTKLALGSTYLVNGNTRKARPLLEDAKVRFDRLKMNVESNVVLNNLGVLELFKEATSAKGLFMIATARTNLSPVIRERWGGIGNNFVLSRINNGLSREVKSMNVAGRDGGDSTAARGLSAANTLEKFILFQTADKGKPIKVSKGDSDQVQNELLKSLLITQGNKKVFIDLEKGNALDQIKSKVYANRVGAVRLDGLNLAAVTKDDFFASLPHLYYFTLPMSIADCYFEMEDFEKAEVFYIIASKYQYLNKEIEVPLVWGKLSSTYVAWATNLYQQGQTLQAKSLYEKIVKLNGEQPVTSNDPNLYRSPTFDHIKVQAEEVLSEYNNLDFTKHNATIAEPLLMAAYNLINIANGIDFPLLSLEREQIPVFRFEYLQNVARYFAGHAIQAERSYINFKTKAEEEEFQQSMLENAVDMAKENEKLEAKMVEVAYAQYDTMAANYVSASTQLSNAKETKQDYANVSWDTKELDALISFTNIAGSGDVDVHSSWGSMGVDTGEQSKAHVVFQANRKRGEINRDYELRNMDRRIENLEAAKNVAEKQKTTALKQFEAALIKKQIAGLRRQQSEDLLDQFNNQEFTPELWNRLSTRMKILSRSYLYRAIQIAGLMEEVYEFELGYPINIIKSNYIKNELSGLLAGDFLLSDINLFTIHDIVTAEKVNPVKEVISLSEQYPFQYIRDFQQTGKMSFNLGLFDLDVTFPGAYNRKIKRIEVVVEGLIGPRGIRGSLTNTGVAFSRFKSGRKQLRLLKPETLLLSEYRISADSIIFPVDPNMLSQFELAPVATSWTIDIPPRSNDLNYQLITDIKLVLFYEALYSDTLKTSVLDEIADLLPAQRQTRFQLKYEFTDSYIDFQDTGEMEFSFNAGHFPFEHADPKIKRIGVFFIMDDRSRPENLQVEVTALADDIKVNQATNAAGMITSSGGASLSNFIDKPLIQSWKIKVPKEDNAVHFDNGFEWRKVSDIALTIEYEYQHRTLSDAPELVHQDSFESDPLASYEKVDDPAATNAGPSKWEYDAAQKQIVQLSNIHGAANSGNSPEKPGTYLIKKASTDVPALRNFVLKSTLSSAVDDGIGLIFRYQDVNNFYFFIMDKQRNYTRLGKKIGGVFNEFDLPSVDLNFSYEIDQEYEVKIIGREDTFKVYIDGVNLLEGSDSSIDGEGRVGFYCWANNNAHFNNIKMMDLK